MGKVYVASRLHDTLDVSDAARYGTLSFISDKYVFPDQVDGELPPPVLSNLRRAVEEFNPDHDYVLIAGDHLQLLVLIDLLARRYAHYRVLRYDRQERGYYSVWIGKSPTRRSTLTTARQAC